MESIRMPTSTLGLPPGDPVRHRTRAGNETPPEARSGTPTDINASVRAAMQQSVSYQIIRRTFAADAGESDQRDVKDPDTSPPAESPTAVNGSSNTSASSETATVEAAETRTTRVDTRTLQVESGDVAPRVEKGDPLLLDLDGNGAETTGLSGAVRFDLDGDGAPDRVSFANGSDAFLALDRNRNGRIDDGRELFGDQDGAVNGFEALRVHDSNGDGRIDAQDPVYDRLQLVRANAAGELETDYLRDSDVAAIELDYRDVRTALNAYDEVAQAGTFRRRDGSLGTVVDVLVGFRRG